MRAATMAGTANTRRNIGASSATEYPALATPIYMLMPAPMSHTGMNHRAAVTIPATGAPALKSRPASTKSPSRTRPPAITLIVCEMAPPIVDRSARFQRSRVCLMTASPCSIIAATPGATS